MREMYTSYIHEQSGANNHIIRNDASVVGTRTRSENGNFVRKDFSEMYGYWDERCPFDTENEELKVTVFKKDDKALIIIANWSDMPQAGSINIKKESLNFTPTKFLVPEIRNLQWEGNIRNINNIEVMGRSGIIIWIE